MEISTLFYICSILRFYLVREKLKVCDRKKYWNFVTESRIDSGVSASESSILFTTISKTHFGAGSTCDSFCLIRSHIKKAIFSFYWHIAIVWAKKHKIQKGGCDIVLNIIF